MNDSTFDEKQGLEVIRKMILRSKQNHSENAIYFLIWGWAILLATLLQYLVLTFHWAINSSYIWIITIGGAIVWAFLAGMFSAKEKQARTFIDHCMTALWGGFAGMMILLGLLSATSNWTVLFPVLIGIYGMAILMSGALLKFRPLIIGGIINFFIAGFAVFVVTNALLLLLAASLICSYLVPGYMLKYQQS